MLNKVHISELTITTGRHPDALSVHETVASSARTSLDDPEVPRSAVGRSVMTLLGAPSTALILIVGARLERWRKVFPESHFVETVTDTQGTAEFYDLIIYHCESVVTRKDLDKALSSLQAMLRPSGYLLLHAPNAYSLKELKKIPGRSFFRPAGCGLQGYRHFLNRAGFKRVYEYLALPTLETAEEMVATGSRYLELPYHWHLLLHLAERFGLFPFIADGYMFIAGKQPLENGRLLQMVGELIGQAKGQSANCCSLERFDLRLRGAMVLFVTEKSSGRHVVVRIVSDTEARKIVCRNHTFLIDLHSCPDLPEYVKEMLPRPIGECCMADTDVYVESLLEGEVAWKLNRTHLRKQIQTKSAEFIFQLQLGTRRKVRLKPRELNELFADDLMRLDALQGVSESLSRTVAATVSKIKQKLHGQEVFLTASHGDFGYGNILVNAGTGELNGVIDWDTGRMRDLPGIDYLNMEVQRIRIESSCDLSSAFQAVVVKTLSCGSIDLKGEYNKHLGLIPDLLPALLSLTLIRYLTRAAQYPEVFDAEQLQYIDSFDVLSVEAPL